MSADPRPEERPYAETPPEIVAALGAVPTGQQWAAISHPMAPSAVIAGAGAGKTAVMAARLVYLALVRLGRLRCLGFCRRRRCRRRCCRLGRRRLLCGGLGLRGILAARGESGDGKYCEEFLHPDLLVRDYHRIVAIR